MSRDARLRVDLRAASVWGRILMAIWFKLNINDEALGTVEIRRREHLDISNPAAIAGVRSTYEVRRDGRLVGQVRHVYGHGAWHLLSLVSSLLATDDLARRSAVAYSDRANADARQATNGTATTAGRTPPERGTTMDTSRTNPVGGQTAHRGGVVKAISMADVDFVRCGAPAGCPHSVGYDRTEPGAALRTLDVFGWRWNEPAGWMCTNGHYVSHPGFDGPERGQIPGEPGPPPGLAGAATGSHPPVVDHG